MELLKTGDPCPCCGQPIQTQDLRELYLLTRIRSWMRLNRNEISYRDYVRETTDIAWAYDRAVGLRNLK